MPRVSDAFTNAPAFGGPRLIGIARGKTLTGSHRLLTAASKSHFTLR
jgi:hypothetical protein